MGEEPSEQWIETLRSHGERVGEGRLLLDAEKAREKMRLYQFEHPSQYVLQIVRAAHLAEATKLEFRIDSDELSAVFDRTLDFGRLRDLWNAGIQMEDVPESALAMGLGAVLSPELDHVSVETSGPQGTARLRLDETGESFEVVPGDPGVVGTRIYVREKRRLDHLWEWMATLDGAFAEARFLRSHCRWASMPIVANGKVVSRPPEWFRHPSLAAQRPMGAVGTVEDEWGSRASVVACEEPGLTLYVVRHGLLVAEHRMPTKVFGGVGVVETTAVNVDLTHLSAIRNERFGAVVETLGERALFQALRGVQANIDPARRRALFIEAAGRARAVPGRLPQASALVAELAGEQIWPRGCGESDELVSLRELARRGTIGWVVERYPFETRHSPVVLLSRTYDREEALAALGGFEGVVLKNVEDEFRAEQTRLRNFSIWKSRPRQPQPDSAFARSVVDEGRTLWIHLPESLLVHGNAVRNYRIDGRAVRSDVLRDPLFAFDWDGDFEANDRWEDYRNADDDLRALALRMLDAVPDFIDRTVEVWARTPGRRPLAIRWCQAIARGELASRLLSEMLGGDAWSEQFDAEAVRVAVGHSTYRLASVHDTTVSERIDALGGLADLPMFETVAGTWVSIRDLDEHADIFWVAAGSALAEELRTVEVETAAEAIVVALAEERDALDAVFGERLANGQLTIDRRTAREEFLRRPFWTPERAPVLATQSRTVAGWPVECFLVARDVPQSTIFWVREGRLLRKQRLDASALGGEAWFVVRSDDLPTTFGWDHLQVTEETQLVVEACNGPLRADLLEAWIRDVAELAAVERATARRFFDALQYVAMRDRLLDEPVVTVIRRGSSGSAEFGRRSLQELRSRDLVALTDERVPPEIDEFDELVWVADADLSKRQATALFGDGVFDLTFRGAGENEAARRTFLERPYAGFEVPGMVEGTMVRDPMGELLLCTVHDSFRPAAGPSRIKVLLYGRLLEEMVVPTPFGSFRGVAQGERIQGDGKFRRVVRGRRAVEDLVRRASEELVATVCRSVREASNAVAHRVRGLELLALCLAREADFPASVSDEIRALPLFRTTGGRTVGWDRVLALRRGEFLPFGGRVSDGPEGVLFDRNTPPGARALLERHCRLREEPDNPVIEEARQEERQRAEPKGADATSRTTETSRSANDDIRRRVFRGAPAVSIASEESRSEASHVGEPEPTNLLRLLTETLAELGQDRIRLRPSASSGGGLCEVTADEVKLDMGHPLVLRTENTPSEATVLLLASVLMTAVNEQLASITDVDERSAQLLALQRISRIGDVDVD